MMKKRHHQHCKQCHHRQRLLRGHTLQIGVLILLLLIIVLLVLVLVVVVPPALEPPTATRNRSTIASTTYHIGHHHHIEPSHVFADSIHHTILYRERSKLLETTNNDGSSSNQFFSTASWSSSLSSSSSSSSIGSSAGGMLLDMTMILDNWCQLWGLRTEDCQQDQVKRLWQERLQMENCVLHQIRGNAMNRSHSYHRHHHDPYYAIRMERDVYTTKNINNSILYTIIKEIKNVPQYQPHFTWGNDKFPDVTIAGLPKTGTTQLYNILISHPYATYFNVEKEFCYNPNWDGDWEQQIVNSKEYRQQIFQQLYQFHQELIVPHITTSAHQPNDILQEEHQTVPMKGRTRSRKMLSINGCLSVPDVFLRRLYLNNTHGITNKKFILIYRDPADWVWSTMNFWRLPYQDVIPTETGHTDTQYHYRSPELFHQWLLAGNTNTAMNLVWSIRRDSTDIARRLISLVGKDQILFLRNEDLLPWKIARPNGALDHISLFTGLDRDLFESQKLLEIRNCNDKKGVNASCGMLHHDDSKNRGSYSISGRRPMLEQSKTLVYLYFWEECKIWAKEFGIMYPSCLNVMNRTQSRSDC